MFSRSNFTKKVLNSVRYNILISAGHTLPVVVSYLGIIRAGRHVYLFYEVSQTQTNAEPSLNAYKDITLNAASAINCAIIRDQDSPAFFWPY